MNCLPAITFIYIVPAEISAEARETFTSVFVNTVNAGRVVSALIIPAVVNIYLAVFPRESVLADALVVIDPVHAVLDPRVLRSAPGLQTLVDVDLAVFTFETCSRLCEAENKTKFL